MTEAEALDMAARAAGWGDWENADPRTRELSSIRAHAKTIMENAALKAENEQLREALMEIMELPGEINPSNYDHDDVCELNRQFCSTYEIARTALERIDHDRD